MASLANATTPYPYEHLEFEPPMTVSQWADERRVLSSFTSAESGPWHTERTPYLQGPMDDFSDPLVTEIVMVAATQVGKTEFILNCLGFAVDYNPCPTMVVLPRDDDAKIWARDRVRPMLESSHYLARHLTGREEDLQGKVYRCQTMNIKFAGANSPADLSSTPCGFVFFDEVDKFPKWSGREANPVTLGTKRTNTFYNHKIIKTSTPTLTTGLITEAFERTDKRRYWVACPHCGAYQPMVFSREEGPGKGQMIWPKDATPNEILEGRLAQYQCGECQEPIHENLKFQLLQSGVWCPEGGSVTSGGELINLPASTARRGYHLPAWYSPWVSWSEIVQDFLETKDTPEQFMGWVNSVAAEPWREKVKGSSRLTLEVLRMPYEKQDVPDGVLLLTASVDVQLDHFWFVIRGWGYHEDSWLIDCGRLERFEDVEASILEKEFMRERGDPLRVRLAMMDSGFRTDEVYSFCIQHADRFRPTKGFSSLQANHLRLTRMEKNSRGQMIPGGLQLWSFDSNYYKDKLSRLMHTEPGQRGRWLLPQNVGDYYFEQILAEQKTVTRGPGGRLVERWEKLGARRANHLLDCEVLNCVAADILQVYRMKDPSEVQAKPPASPTVASSSPGWMTPRNPDQRRGGWLRRR